MGVPKFYRWISERYPCLSEVVKENQIPEFDNLYLDMNGIIHPCSHPNDEDVHFRITEEQIFKAIFHYIEVLFRIIKPRKVFFMAVDGVAPRAKMNQQRGRRFRSAKEAEEREKEAVSKGEVLPTEKRFDSNCITPGTPFMVRLQEQLKYFVRQKLTKDPTWQGLRVYLSGHETPGEGEHKIMDFIRAEKADQNYDPNTRHCLYGLDADLIMLGLISHEPHFSLLREEVRFGKIANQKRPTTPEETTFHLLHLSLMREYLEIEFSSVKSKIDWFDGERIIDDWVLMGFLVGNDFIPHLPDMHISHNALPRLYKTYMAVLPTLGGYLNNHGKLNLSRFEKFLSHLSQFDKDNFEETNANLGLFAGKTDIRAWESERVKGKKQQEKDRRAAKALTNQFTVLDNLDELMGAPGMKPESESKNTAFQTIQDSLDDDDFDDTFDDEFKAHKTAYYSDKFEVENITDNQLAEIVYNYILAIQWILDYYYNGIQSWGWYYPYHYAPYMSDLQGFSNANLKYERGKPFLPFQQLLGVLPAASKELLPLPYQRLMTLDSSPIIDYYPLDFASDLNGKLQQWEAVVLIPFIDEKRLLAAMDEVSKYLTDEEKGRNQHGPHLLNTYDETVNYTYPSSMLGHFPDVNACKARCDEIPKDAFHLHPSKLYYGLCKGVKFGVYFPGFPTLHHLQFSSTLKKDDIKIFQQNSRGDSVILTVQTENPDVKAEDVAKELLGKTCFAEWPHLREVRVVAVADDAMRYELEDTKLQGPDSADKSLGFKSREMSDFDAGVWVRDIKAIQERYHKRKGVKIGPSYVVVYACPLMGRRYISGVTGIITLEKQWALRPVPFAYQMLVKDIAVHDSTFQQFKTLEEVYPTNSQCFMLGSPNYGCQGNVVEIENGRVRVLFSVPVEPNLSHVKNSQDRHEVQYLPAYVLGQRLGLTSLIISRLSGTIFVGRGSRSSSSVGPSKNFNVGLNLKFNKTSQEIQGYSKKDEAGTWLYSTKVIDVMKDYMTKFPEVFNYLSKHPRDDNFFEDDLFKGRSGRMKELQDFISDMPCAKASKVAIGLKNLDEPIVKLIEEEVQKSLRQKLRKQKMAVRPHLLYRPLHYLGNLIPDPEAEHELFDRVINVREGFSVPLGLRGVIIGIQPGSGILDYLYEVVFDEEFPGGLKIRCTGHRGYKVPTTAVINISYGMRKEQCQQQSNKPMAVVKPQAFPQPNAQTQSQGWYSNMVTKLGSNQEQQVQRQPQQQQQQQVSKSKKQPQAQTPSKGAINYRAALGQDSSFKQASDQKLNKQATASPMTILTRSGPKLISRSPTKDPHGKVYDKQPRHQGKDQMDKEVTPKKTQGQNSDAKSASKGEVNVDAGSGRRIPKETSKMQESKPVSEVDEFADMWRNLQKGTSSSGTSSPFTEDTSTDKDERNVESDDLTSPFTSGGQTPLSEEDLDRGPSIQMQLALSALPKVDASMPVVADDSVGDDIVLEGNVEDEEVEEFQTDEEARMTPRTYAKSGTAELCRMLNIASMSASNDGVHDDLIIPHSVIIEASKETKQYGRPLSLVQLFAGAVDTQPSPGTSPVPLTPTNLVNAPTLPQGVPQGVQQGVQQRVHQGVPQGVHQGVHQGVPQGVHQGVPQGVHQGVHQGVPQGVHQGVPQGVHQGVPQGVHQGVPQGVPQGVHQGVPQGVHQGVPQGVHQGVPQGVHQGVPQGVQQGVPQGVPQPTAFHTHPQQPMPIPGYHHPADTRGSMSPGRVGPTNISNSNANPPQPIHLHGQLPVSMSMGSPLATGPEGFPKGTQMIATRAQTFPAQQMGLTSISQGAVPTSRLSPAHYLPQSAGAQPSSVATPAGVVIIRPGVQPLVQQQGFAMHSSGQISVDQQQQLPPWQRVVVSHHQGKQQPFGPQIQAQTVRIPGQHAMHTGLGPQNVGPAQQTISYTQPNMNTAAQQNMGPAHQHTGPAHQNTGSSNIVRVKGQPLKQVSQLNIQPIMGMAAGMTGQTRGPSQHHPQNFGPSGQLIRTERPAFVQGFQGQRHNAVQALSSWCQHQNLNYRFHFQKNPKTGLCGGIVQLSNGAQFVGPDCPNTDTAAEAVAHATMTQVTKVQPRGMFQQLRPTTRPPIGMNQHQGVMFHASGANPFVPLQVTKQLNSPSRFVPASEMKTSPARIVPNPQMEYPTSPGPSVPQMDSANMATNQAVFLENPTLRSRGISGVPPNTGMEQTLISGVDVYQGTDHPKKQVSSAAAVKSRRGSSKAKLAINFGSKN